MLTIFSGTCSHWKGQQRSDCLPLSLFSVTAGLGIGQQVIQASLLQDHVADHAPVTPVLDLLLQICRRVLVPA